MAKWRLSTTIKKCIFEYQVYAKGDERITLESTWRWGRVTIETEDDTPPDIDLSEDASVDVTLIENSEIDMLEDHCCFTDSYEYFGHDIYEYIDNDGWECIDSEIYFEGPLALERIG